MVSAQEEELARWAENVGDPVVLDLAQPLPPGPLRGVDVLCWNVFIGAGRLDSVLSMLRAGAWGGAGQDPQRPLVVLVQEAFRTDASVPERPRNRFIGSGVPLAGRTGVVDVALAQSMSLRYVPSMRNGTGRSDKGNAILATAALTDARMVVLPYVRQRRVAVAADLVGLPWLAFLSAHLDTRGARKSLGFWRGTLSPFGEGRAAQAAALAAAFAEGNTQSVILGADLNAAFGARDPAYLTLVRAGFEPGKRVGRFGHTFHTPVQFPVDFVMYYSPLHRIADVEVIRLDERAGDESRHVFGSDHHPLLARVSFAGSSE